MSQQQDAAFKSPSSDQMVSILILTILTIGPQRTDVCNAVAHMYTLMVSSSDDDDDEIDEYNDELCTLRCTNSFTEHDYTEGWRLCQNCRPSENVMYARARQIGCFARAYIQLHQIILNPPLHYGYCSVSTRAMLRRLNFTECQCPCAMCWTPGNGQRGARDFTDMDRMIAHRDVDAFITGELTIPSRPTNTRRCRY